MAEVTLPKHRRKENRLPTRGENPEGERISIYKYMNIYGYDIFKGWLQLRNDISGNIRLYRIYGWIIQIIHFEFIIPNELIICLQPQRLFYLLVFECDWWNSYKSINYGNLGIYGSSLWNMQEVYDLFKDIKIYIFSFSFEMKISDKTEWVNFEIFYLWYFCILRNSKLR